MEGWKKRVASPTYGMVIGFLTLSDNDGNEIDQVAIPGFELRIFNGTNAAKRGGLLRGLRGGDHLLHLQRERDLHGFSGSL
ncbi:MAG: hypothetical protein SVR04_09285 [Spirochaetota bacterium]|nr:hypothetical protein [Spirochaetota bacterium]